MESAITFPLRINFAVPPVLTGSGFNATEMSSMSFPSLSQVSHLNDFPLNIPSRDVAVESRTGEDDDEEEEAEKIKAEYTSKEEARASISRTNSSSFSSCLFVVNCLFYLGNVTIPHTQKLLSTRAHHMSLLLLLAKKRRKKRWF